jgi:hypothetical protein
MEQQNENTTPSPSTASQPQQQQQPSPQQEQCIQPEQTPETISIKILTIDNKEMIITTSINDTILQLKQKVEIVYIYPIYI